MALTLAEYKAKGIKLENGMPVKCARCSTVFEYAGTSHRREHCSEGCRAQKYNEEARVKLEPRPCVICGEMFVPENPRYKACPGECREVRRTERNRSREKPAPRSPDEIIREREIAAHERKIREGTGRTAILADLLLEATDKINAKDIKPYKAPPKRKRDPETMVVLRSDLHPGLITPSYNLEVFHRRMELFTEKVILIRDIITETIPIEKLVVIDEGDLVSGQGIFPNLSWKSETHVLEQIYEHASPALCRQNLTWLDYFPCIEEHSVPGNHGRTGKEHPDEVNFDNIVAQDIAARFGNVGRYSMEIEWDWYKLIQIYGWKFLALHGSQIRSWLNIPFYGLIQKGMRWQGSISEKWHYLVHGHFHTPFNFPWNDFEIIGNGTTVSDDDFGLRELGMSSTPAQQVFGVHPEHGVTWRYTLDLT